MVEPVVIEVSVGVELGVGVVETLSGSVPVATIAVSPEALWTVDVGSWLISVVGLGLIVDAELELALELIAIDVAIEDTSLSLVPVAAGTEARDSSPGPESSWRLMWRTLNSNLIRFWIEHGRMATYLDYLRVAIDCCNKREG